MTEEKIIKANKLIGEIKTLKVEIETLSNMEDNTRTKKEGTHKLLLKKLLGNPIKKTYKNYWSSQDLDSINSIILFDPDEIELLKDFKQQKVERLEKEIEAL